MENLNKRLLSIEERLSRIESELQSYTGSKPGRDRDISGEEPDATEFRLIGDNSSLEFNIGRYGLAWVGNVVLLLGIIFLTQWINSLGKTLIASVIGFTSVAGLLGMQYYLRQANAYLSFLFKLVGYFLLYYFTLRLHYFTDSPIIPGEPAGLVLVSFVVLLQLYVGIARRKEFFSTLAILLGYFTALVSNKPVFLLGLTVILAGITLYLQVRSGWKRTFIISMLTGYFVYLLWILNNPLMGNPMEVISTHHQGYIYLFAYAVIFAIVPLFKAKTTMNQDFLAGTLWLNSLGFSLMLLLIVLQFFTDRFAGLFTVISLLCIGYAAALMVRKDWKFGSAFYALYGFLALSIALYGLFGIPEVNLYLAAESLLVVSIALWFRNKLIVIMNGVLFIVLLIAYFISEQHLDSVNFAFAMVPLITARVLNWKKERLEIKTDMLRNLYLVIGFVTVLYALYQAVPGKYVSLSWTIVAVLYFLMSFVIKNVKYRFMGIGTVIAVALYLFMVDLARIEIAYRVLAFLFLALISIAVSVYYSRRMPHRE